MEAKAQISEELSSSMPEQWQLTLDVIKSKAADLMVKNNGLQDEYRQLLNQQQKLQQSVWDQQTKNEEMSRLLNVRHGRTNQEEQIEQLSQAIKIKNQRIEAYGEQIDNLNRKKAELDHKIQLLKITVAGLELHEQANQQPIPEAKNNIESPVDDQLIELRKQNENENNQEVLLENELATLKNGDQAQHLNVNALEEENKQLEDRLDQLRLEKLQYDKHSSNLMASNGNEQRYEKLKKRKDELEANISVYEMRMESLRDTSLMSMSWPLKKKKIVHEMVQIDAHNNQIRGKIKVVKEDIAVLKDQVTKLDHQLEFVKGQQILP